METRISFCLEGGNYLVAGASSGIGKQVVSEIVKGGGIALAIARNEERLYTLSLENQERIITKSVDVRDSKGLEDAICGFVSRYGKFHGSVYTAGMSKTTVLKSFVPETAREVMDVNFWGWVNLMQILCKRKYTQDGCSHVVVSSVSAQKGEAGNFAYNASKAALLACVRTFAKEIGKRRCRVNAVSPGVVCTAMSREYFAERGFSEKALEKHILGAGEPEDVSGLILYLLCDRAKWITGSDFVVDGGYLAGS